MEKKRLLVKLDPDGISAVLMSDEQVTIRSLICATNAIYGKIPLTLRSWESSRAEVGFC